MGARRVSSDSKAALRWLLYSHEIGGPPQGLFGPWGYWQCLQACLAVTALGWILLSSLGQKPRMLINLLYCPGHPSPMNKEIFGPKCQQR